MLQSALCRVTGIVLLAGLSLANTGAAVASTVSIAASVSGDPSLITGTFTQEVNPATGQIVDNSGAVIPLVALPFLTYGPFTVNGGNDLGATFTTIGDGINDEVWWVFDFINDANIAAFRASTDPLVSAKLTISLIPGETNADGAVFVPGLNGTYPLPLTGIAGVEETHMIDLIQPDQVPRGQAHRAEDILNRLNDDGSTGPSRSVSHFAGQLPFKYIDDALVTSATLTLTKAPEMPPIPLPAGMWLILSALGITFGLRRVA